MQIIIIFWQRFILKIESTFITKNTQIYIYKMYFKMDKSYEIYKRSDQYKEILLEYIFLI